MATIYKRDQDKGKKLLRGHRLHRENGKRRTKKGFTDKGETETLAGLIQQKVNHPREGLIDPELEKAAERRNIPIKLHVDAFERSCANNSARYVKLVVGRVRRVVKGCRFETISDVNEEAIAEFLNKLAKEEPNFGNRTYNHYVQAFHTFCQWALRTKRITSNPIIGMKRLNTEVDIRRRRRARN